MLCRNYMIVAVVAAQLFLSLPLVHAQASKSEGLFPFAIGTEWTYESTTREKNGRVLERKVDTSKVIGVHLFGDERWYSIDEFDTAIWSRNTSKGEEEAEITIDEETGLLKKETSFLFFKYPANKGDQWKTQDMSDEIPEQSMRLKDVGVKLEVPAGTFECYLYELIEDGEVVIKFHVAPGVGIVKFEMLPTYNNKGESVVHELKKYVVGKY